MENANDVPLDFKLAQIQKEKPVTPEDIVKLEETDIPLDFHFVTTHYESEKGDELTLI